MTNILHGTSPEVEHILGFFGLKFSDFITKFSFKIDRESLSYSYSRYTDKTATEIFDDTVVVPFDYKIYLSILNLLGLEHDKFTSISFDLTSSSDIAQLTVEKELSADSIKKQEVILSDLIEKINCANS